MANQKNTQKFYTVYKITNQINGKVYVGKHETYNLQDGYMGSGKLIKAAINKYGVDNFTKEILHVFDTEAEMNAKETELVVICESSYNLCPGGKGGFGYINSKVLTKKQRQLGRQNANKTLLEKHGADFAKVRATYHRTEKQRESSRLKAKQFLNAGYKKKVHDSFGNMFESIQDYAKFYNVGVAAVTRRLKLGQNCYYTN